MRPVNKTPWRTLTITGDDYAAARQMVLTTTGFYCSYCEAPLGVDMPVEHKAPKSGESQKKQANFPDEATKYSNFVMACSSCNSQKGSRPSLDQGAAFFKTMYPNWNKSIEYPDLLYGALFSMVWPDWQDPKINHDSRDVPVPPEFKNFYTGRDETFRLFSYEIAQQSQTQLKAAGLLRLSDDAAKAEWAAKPQSMVWVAPNLTYIQQQQNADMLRRRVQNTLQVLNLNLYNSANPEASDRRVFNRTSAYKDAANALAELAAAVDKFGLYKKSSTDFTDQTFAMIQLIRELALATGYWSTWMTVFAEITAGTKDIWKKLANDDARKALVSATLVRYTVNEKRQRVYSFQDDPPPIFPGTDLFRVQL